MDRHMSRPGVHIDRADLADLLTFIRLLSIPALVWLLSTHSLEAAIVLAGFAWSTDFLDGKFARTAPRETRLKEWDLRADAWLATGLGIGLALGGYSSWWITAPIAAVVFGGSLWLSNPSSVMVGIGTFSAMFLWAVYSQANLWWLPPVYLVVLLVANWPRFWGVIAPALWHSLTAFVPGDRRRARGLVLDDWID